METRLDKPLGVPQLQLLKMTLPNPNTKAINNPNNHNLNPNSSLNCRHPNQLFKKKLNLNKKVGTKINLKHHKLTNQKIGKPHNLVHRLLNHK